MTLPPKRIIKHVDLIHDSAPTVLFPNGVPYNHWNTLHEKTDATPEWLAEWEGGIPCGECKVNYLLIKDRIAPRFGPGWFEWTWELHNAINAHLVDKGHEQFSIDDAKACWLGIAPCRSSRLVLTISVGRRFTDLLKLTRPSMERYAARCGADFLALTNQKYEQWQREKFRVHDFATQYEQTLFLDSDVIVRDDADNVFETYAGCAVAMHDDLAKNDEINKGAWRWKDEYSDMLRSQRAAAYAPDEVMWNSGIVLTSRQGASVWQPPTEPLPSHHCSEQFFVQHQCRGLSVARLESAHNWQYWFSDFQQGLPSAQFVHLANCPNKIEATKEITTKTIGSKIIDRLERFAENLESEAKRM